ncbi:MULTISPECIES: hypothetical protein [unclassified Marinovum]|uniref:hypothetical protein n=1 Tax=unclassified Marinovum TaxID=2647166 RepID=UPI003EDC242E
MIRIKGDGIMSSGVAITTEAGEPIEGVTSLNLRMEPNAVVVAEISVMTQVVDVLAHPLLDLTTLEAAADAHGYRLVKAE